MTQQAIVSDLAPDSLGPYSQAIVAGGFVFCSGMAGIDPATGTIAPGVEAQTEQALLNLSAVLAAAGASLADLVKTTIFYAEVEDLDRLSTVYARHMPDPPPARSAPANVRLPHGLLVSIEAIAFIPDGAERRGPEALDRRDSDGLTAAAAALADAGCRYQWARTLVLIGGEQRARGESVLATMGATPMVWPPE